MNKRRRYKAKRNRFIRRAESLEARALGMTVDEYRVHVAWLDLQNCGDYR